MVREAARLQQLQETLEDTDGTPQEVDGGDQEGGDGFSYGYKDTKHLQMAEGGGTNPYRVTVWTTSGGGDLVNSDSYTKGRLQIPRNWDRGISMEECGGATKPLTWCGHHPTCCDAWVPG